MRSSAVAGAHGRDATRLAHGDGGVDGDIGEARVGEQVANGFGLVEDRPDQGGAIAPPDAKLTVRELCLAFAIVPAVDDGDARCLRAKEAEPEEANTYKKSSDCVSACRYGSQGTNQRYGVY